MTLQSNIRLCSCHTMVIIDKLPEELLMEILCRLPVRSLLRSKSVCKAWYSLIQNPSFISIHLNHAASAVDTENTHCILVSRPLNGGYESYDDAILSLIANKTLVEDIDTSSIGPDIKGLQLWGPCNGVICLKTYNSIALCNPSMREFRVLPEPFYKWDYMSNLGFGFDPSTNDYKVVKFGYYIPCTIVDDIEETFEIYELSTDSWRKGHVNTQIQIDVDFFSFASWKGDCYWYMYSPRGPDAIIMFRMTDEVFDAKPVPEVCSLDSSLGGELFVMNDSLALVLFLSEWQELFYPIPNYPENCFDIWVMDEKGVEVSWTKRFTIGPLEWIEYPLGFQKNGEFLLVNKARQMMSYNLDTQQMKEYQVYRHPPSRCSQVFLYTESLVSVKRHNEHDGHDDLHVLT